MNTKAPRRDLDLRDFDALLRDLDRLQSGGYESVGRWNLGQTCGHLADWLQFPLDGFPPQPWPIRLMLAGMRMTIGRRALRQLLQTRRMPDRRPTFPDTIPQPDCDEAAAVERLRQTIERFRAHTGPIHPSPVFGAMDRETCSQLQLIHCVHHLSFLVPKAAQA